MSDAYEQMPFDPGFAANPERRCPCLLLLDTSYSMSGERIRELNAGLRTFREELMADDMAARSAEVALVSFGGKVNGVNDFTPPEDWTVPELAPDGNTPMGEAIELGLQLLDRRKATYRGHGVPYYRPWVFLITDGGPTDEWEAAAHKVQRGEERGAFSFFAIGVEGARMDVLAKITPRQPLRLKGLMFRELFQWLSASIGAASRSSQNEGGVQLVDPTRPNGWATV